MEIYKKILIAIDDSKVSLKAAEMGIQLSTQLGAECAIVFVIDATKTHGDVYSEELPHDRLAKLGIVNTAEEWQADLIVMGTSGKSGIKRIFLGSTAENTIRLSKTPLLIVPN